MSDKKKPTSLDERIAARLAARREAAAASGGSGSARSGVSDAIAGIFLLSPLLLFRFCSLHFLLQRLWRRLGLCVAISSFWTIVRHALVVLGMCVEPLLPVIYCVPSAYSPLTSSFFVIF